MPLRSPINARERILSIGGFGAGKTTGILHIAKKLPDSKFYVLDTDRAYDRMIPTPDILPNVIYKRARHWLDFPMLTAEFSTQMTSDDWIVVDLLGPAWDAVQDYYSERVFGAGIEDVFLKARENNKKGNALDGDKDWSVINKLYKAWINDLLDVPGHIYATAGIAAVSERDGKEIRQMFGGVGFKPQAQKHAGHIFHTVLLMEKAGTGQWRMTTVKDRERAEVEKQPVNDFAVEYLMKIAGWRPAA